MRSHRSGPLVSVPGAVKPHLPWQPSGGSGPPFSMHGAAISRLQHHPDGRSGPPCSMQEAAHPTASAPRSHAWAPWLHARLCTHSRAAPPGWRTLGPWRRARACASTARAAWSQTSAPSLHAQGWPSCTMTPSSRSRSRYRCYSHVAAEPAVSNYMAVATSTGHQSRGCWASGI